MLSDEPGQHTAQHCALSSHLVDASSTNYDQHLNHGDLNGLVASGPVVLHTVLPLTTTTASLSKEA